MRLLLNCLYSYSIFVSGPQNSMKQFGPNSMQCNKMHATTNETEKRRTSRCHKNSPSAEEAGSGGNSYGGGPLKKGPWTSAEDAILVEYVNKHGEGNWNAVQKHSGLSRCGKSCRLRWANHLRPDLKKGAFTAEEESRIMKLHAKMGNKWARMASELPGRTDNEIKNFWNTRIKRLQRAGLPIYPPDISFQAIYESQQGQGRSSCRTGEKNHSDLSPPTDLVIPDVEFQNLELRRGFFDRPTALLDIPTSSILQNGASPSHGYSLMLPAVHPHKHLREMETPFTNSIGSTGNVFSSFDQYDDDSYGKSTLSFWESSPYDPDLNINDISALDALHGSHASINGTTSSEPFSVAMKLELPSLQYPTPQVGSWTAPSSPLPSLESVDTLIQSPLSEHAQSNCPSPRNSGLLEAIVYESRSMKNTTNNSYQQLSEASVMAGNMVEFTAQNICDTKWEGCGDPMSPLSQSAASVFFDHTPVSGSSSEERQSAETMLGCYIKPEITDWVSVESGGKKDIASQLEFLRPDAMLDSFCFGQRTVHGNDQPITTHIGLFGDDLSCEYKQVGVRADDANQSCRSEASGWDSVSAVCHSSKDH